MRRDESSVVRQYLLKLCDLKSMALLQKTCIPIEQFRAATVPCFNHQIFTSDTQSNNKNIFHYLAWAPEGEELEGFFKDLMRLKENISPNPLWEKMRWNCSYDISPLEHAIIKGNLQYARLIFGFQITESPTVAVVKLQDVCATFSKMLASDNHSYMKFYVQFLGYAIKQIEDIIRSKENKAELLQKGILEPTKNVSVTVNTQAETIQSQVQKLEKELKDANEKLLTSGLIKACELYERVNQARADDKASIAQLYQNLSTTARRVHELTDRITNLHDANVEKEQQISRLTTELSQARLEIESLRLQLSKENHAVTNMTQDDRVSYIDPNHVNTTGSNPDITDIVNSHQSVTTGADRDLGYRKFFPDFNNLHTLFPKGHSNKRAATEELQSVNKYTR